MFYPLAKSSQRLIELGRIVSRASVQRLRVFLFACDVFAFFGEREITVNRREHVGSQRERELLFHLVCVVKVGRDQHESEIGFRRDDAERSEERRRRSEEHTSELQ